MVIKIGNTIPELITKRGILPAGGVCSIFTHGRSRMTIVI